MIIKDLVVRKIYYYIRFIFISFWITISNISKKKKKKLVQIKLSADVNNNNKVRLCKTIKNFN